MILNRTPNISFFYKHNIADNHWIPDETNDAL